MHRYLPICLVILLGFPAYAATINAPSCSRADVVAAINSASDGDTVFVPAGNCTWSSAISISKGISVLGAGMDMTNISGGGFSMLVPSGKPWRVGHMTFSGTSGFDVSSNSKNWRIDHIRFSNVSGFAKNRVIWIQPTNGDSTAGVVDNCIFDNPKSIQVHYRGPDSDGGNNSYLRPLGLGGNDAVYIEDNQFNHATLEISNPITDCDGGGRFVFRHNTAKNSYVEMHDAIIVGIRSCRKWEIYDNTFETTYASGQCAYIAIRGGTGVAFNNLFKNAVDCDPILLDLYRTYQADGDPWDVLCSRTSGKACLGTPTAAPKGCTTDSNCGGTAGACIAIDGVSTSPNGSLCRDQIGADGNNPQVSRPALFWNNRYSSGAYVQPSVNSGASYLRAGTEYCGGTTGMPASCNGVGTNYTPYTYPHPLTQALPTPLAAPTNLRLN